MRNIHRVSGTALIVVLATGAAAFAQAPGEKVYVVNNTVLKSGAKTIGQVTQGNILKIEEVSDRWLRVDYKQFGSRGWIPRQDTVSLQAALEQFTYDIQIRPTPYAYIGRALIYKDRREMDLALRDLDAALRLNPNSPSALHTRGVLWMQQKQWARSIPDFDSVLRLTTNPVVLGSAHHNRGIALLRLKEFEKAIADFDACLQLMPLNSADTYANRGEARNFLNGNLDLALADLNEALRLNPKHEKAWSMRAANYTSRGDWDRALADYNEGLLLDPDNATALDNRGVIWEKKGNLDQALLDFNAAIQYDPDFAPAFRHRAGLFELRGELEKAEADYSDSLRFSEPQDRVLALVSRAGFYARHDAVDKAQADISTAQGEIDHTRFEPLQEVASFLATCPKAELRDGARATDLAREACQLTGFTNVASLDVLAAAYATSGEFDKAVETEKRAAALSRDVKQRETFEERIEHYAHREPPTNF